MELWKRLFSLGLAMLRWFKSKKVKEAVSEAPIEWIEESAEALYQYFSETTGIHFDQNEHIATLKLVRFAKEHRSHSFSNLLSRLKSEQMLMQQLINFLTVNETYFFREMDQINYMVGEIKKSTSSVRILCAPGSTGEEPYSILIALSEAGIDMGRISMVSIDINTEAIRCSETGVYSKRSIYRLAPAILERYFTVEGEKYHLRNSVRRCVEFKALNLFDPNLSVLGKFDYIFSRNMLIYFNSVKTALAIERLISLSRSSSTIFFFGHADIVNVPFGLKDHYVDKSKFFTKV